MPESPPAEQRLRECENRLRCQQTALLSLSREDLLEQNDMAAALRRLTEVLANTLNVYRVSVWRFNADHSAISCIDLFDLRTGTHSCGTELLASSYPAYFQALASSNVIVADDAHVDPRTNAFSRDYLTPLDIGAMLDVPIRLFGRLEGVLCHEHVGSPRTWTQDEQVFALAVANFVTLVQEQWEKRQAQQKLLESEARYRLLFESNPQSMWVFDEQTFQFLEVNSAAIAMYGYSRDEFLNMTLLDIRPQDDRPPFFAFARLSHPPLVQVQTRHCKKDGTLIDVDIASHRIQFGDRPARLVISRDITEQKRTEAQLRLTEEQFRQAQKMEAIGRLAGGVAHDFNNLLTIINGYTQILLGAMHEHDRTRVFVEEIGKAGERAANLTRQLLAFGRKQMLQLKVLQLNDLITDMSKMLHRLLGEDVELRTGLTSELWQIKADPGQLEQVIMNIALNARDAMPTGGVLTLETANIELGESFQENGGQDGMVRPGPYVRLTFRDTGCGMDAKTRSRIFEPFFTTKPQGQGTGLGLATVYGIVKQSNGYIKVASTPGAGTTFDLYLPATDDVAWKTRNTLTLDSDSGGRETILLVEDEEGVRSLARQLLHSKGYNVLEAANGTEALSLAAQYAAPISLLVSDVVMPGMSGRELAERLRESRPALRVMYVSGYTDDAIMRHGITDQSTDLLPKPFDLEALARKVREILDRPA